MKMVLILSANERITRDRQESSRGLWLNHDMMKLSGARRNRLRSADPPAPLSKVTRYEETLR